MKIVAVMPLKFSNKRLPGKYKKLLNGKEMYLWMLNSLIKCELVDDIYIYTSDICEILNTPCTSKKVKILQRDPIFDSDEKNFTEIFQSFVDLVKADIYVYAHATAPFVMTSTITKCIKIVSSEISDSSYTAIQEKDFFWYDQKPINYNPLMPLPRSQDLKPIIRETSGVYVFRRELFECEKTRISIKAVPIPIGRIEAIDINDEFDFKVAQTFEKKLGSNYES
jgi:CMP-N-acetylneuraminic acid synthetase